MEKKSAGRSEKCEAIEVIREEMALPKYVVLKSKYNEYLRYIHEYVQIHGFLQFSREEIV